MNRNDLMVLRAVIKEELQAANSQLFLLANGMEIILNNLKEINENIAELKEIRSRATLSGKVKRVKAAISKLVPGKIGKRVHGGEKPQG